MDVSGRNLSAPARAQRRSGGGRLVLLPTYLHPMIQSDIQKWSEEEESGMTDLTPQEGDCLSLQADAKNLERNAGPKLRKKPVHVIPLRIRLRWWLEKLVCGRS